MFIVWDWDIIRPMQFFLLFLSCRYNNDEEMIEFVNLKSSFFFILRNLYFFYIF